MKCQDTTDLENHSRQYMLNIVCFISQSWKRYQRRPHYTAMARHARVLIVEPPLCLVPSHSKKSQFHWLGNQKRRLRRIDDSLYIYTPVALFPYGISYRNSLLSYLNRRVLSRDIGPVLTKLQMQDFIQIFFFPYQDCIVRILSPMLCCPEIVDESTTLDAPDTDLTNPRVARKAKLEKKILQDVDIVFATSSTLTEQKKRFNPSTYFVPNAADFEHFNRASRVDTRIPDEIASIPSPQLGFVGNLTDFVDIHLLEYLASSHPEWSIILIGAMNIRKDTAEYVRFRELCRCPNVYYLGWREYELLPRYMKSIDVYLLPYRLCDRMRYSHPNKMYQYLAAGKPTVSTNFPEVRSLKHVIKVSRGYEDFRCKVEEALRECDPELVAQRLKVAQENTVEVRAKQKIAIIQAHLDRQGKQG